MENQDEKDARHRVQVEQHHRHLDGKYPEPKVVDFPAVFVKLCLGTQTNKSPITDTLGRATN